MFKRKQFSIFTDHNGLVFEKQKQALFYLTDDVVCELTFGGGAGGSKSFTGWLWLTLMSLAYDETHYFVARETLKDIRMYGMQTFTEVKNFLNLELDVDYKYNAQDSYIIFSNKSKIYFLECKKKPSDLDFHGLGSSLFTSGMIEEAGEVHFDAYDTLNSRIGRWKNDEYGILGKLFITCNPAHNWLYTEFYQKSIYGGLKANQKYLPALAKDNPYCQKDYVERLSNLKDEVKRQRLYLGIWEYDDDPSALCDYDSICDLFTNTHVKSGIKRMSADLAMMGRDKFITILQDGGLLSVIIDKDKSSAKDIENSLKEKKIEYGVSNTNMVADSDGLGQYLESYIQNIKQFHGGSTKMPSEYQKKYKNLKTACAFKLAEKINNKEYHIKCSQKQQEEIKKELSMCLKRDNVDSDGKLEIMPKDKMKQVLGHSPDYLDALLMLQYFEINQSYSSPIM